MSDSLEEEKEDKKVKFNPEDLDTDLETKGIVMSLDNFSNSFKIFKYLLRHMPKLKSIVLSDQDYEEEDPESDEEEDSCEEDSEFNIDFGNKTKP